MNKNIFTLIYKSFAILLLVLCILMGLSAFEYLDNINQEMFITKLIYISLTSSIFLFISYLLIHKKLHSKYFVLGLIIVSFCLRLIYIFQNNPDQVSDFLYMYLKARELAGSEINALKTDYYSFAVFNTPFTIYEAYLLKWFDSIMLLKTLNVIYSTIIVYYIYKIGKVIYDEKTGRIAGFIACVFPPFIIYNVILTNQTLSILFILMGVYSIINKKYIKGGLLLGLGQIFRPIGIMFLIGAVIIIIMEWLNNEKYLSKQRVKLLFSSITKLVVPYYFVLFFISGCLTGLNFTEHGLFHNPAPSYKLLVGLNNNTNGGYSQSDSNLLLDIENFETIAKEEINKRTVNLIEVSQLFEIKFKKMWGAEDASFFWGQTQNKTHIYYNQLLWIFLLFIGGSILFSKINQDKSSAYQRLFIYIVLLGFIGVYFLIEIQTRYRYELYPLFILIGSAGVKSVLSKVEYSLMDNKNKIKIAAIISILLLLISLPKSIFQRSVDKEITPSLITQTVDVNKNLTEKIQIEKLIISSVNDSITVLRLKLDDKTRASDIYKYAVTLRGNTQQNSKEILWDFNPILYKSKNIKYLETEIKNAPDSLNYLSIALYDRDGYKGLRSAVIRVENIQLVLSKSNKIQNKKD